MIKMVSLREIYKIKLNMIGDLMELIQLLIDHLHYLYNQIKLIILIDLFKCKYFFIMIFKLVILQKE